MESFNDLEWDIFREIGNIGSGHASVAMSHLVDGKTHISMTEALLSSPKKLFLQEFGGQANVDILHLGIEGDLAGDSFLLMFGNTSSLLSKLLLKKRGNKPQSDNLSAIQEFGNIMVGSYLNALSNLVHLSATPKVPNFIPQGQKSIDALGLSSKGKALAIKNQVVNLDYDISVIIFILFDKGSLSKILMRTKPRDIIVIDSPKTAGMIKNLLLEYSNVSVLSASDFATAGALAKERPPHVCLVQESALKLASPQARRKATGKTGRMVVIGEPSSPGGRMDFIRRPITKENLLRLIDGP